MRLQDHISKLSWTMFDKALFVMYGIVTILQMSYASSLEEWGLYTHLISINTWIFILADSYALQCVIQFGGVIENRPKVNTISIILLFMISVVIAFVLYLFRFPLADVFQQPRFVDVMFVLPMLNLLMIPRMFCLRLLTRDLEFAKIFFVNLAFFGTPATITSYYLLNGMPLLFEDIAQLYLIGTAMSSIVSVILAWNKLEFGLKGSLKTKDVLKFSLPVTIHATFHSLPKHLDTIIIELGFSTSVVGIYNAAKQLFRIFDEICNTIYGILYPISVKLLTKDDRESLKSITSKVMTILLVGFGVTALILELGLAEWIISTFLPERFIPAIGYYKVLLLGAFTIPFTILSSVITADGHPEKVVKITFISSSLSILTYYIITYLEIPYLIPLGLVVYYSVAGVLFYYELSRSFQINMKSYISSFVGIINFAKSKLVKNN